MDLFAGRTREEIEALSEWAPLANAIEPLQEATPERLAEEAHRLELAREDADRRGLRPKEAAVLMAAHCALADDPSALEALVDSLTKELAASCRREPAGSIDLMGYAQALPAEVPAESVAFPIAAYYWWWRTGHHPGLWPAVFRPSVYGWPDPGAEDVPERVRQALQCEGVLAPAVKVPATDDERLERVAAWIYPDGPDYNARFAALVDFLAAAEAQGVTGKSDKAIKEILARKVLDAHDIARKETKDSKPEVSGKDLDRYPSFLNPAIVTG